MHLYRRLYWIILFFCLTSYVLIFSGSSSKCRNGFVKREILSPLLTLDANIENIKFIMNKHNLFDSLDNQIQTGKYAEALKRSSNHDGVVFLILTDFGYLDQSLNQYITSIKRLQIHNFLYVSMDRATSETLESHNIAQFLFCQDKDGHMSSTYGTQGYRRKTHMKTTIILEALKLGFTVFIVDVDIVFLKNPLPFLTCPDCDIQIQNDLKEGNSGFYLARPTTAAIELHISSLRFSKRFPKLTNQKTLGKAIEMMLASGRLKLDYLPNKLFQIGCYYFYFKMFADKNPCIGCVIIHNNYVASKAAKEYRLKEHLLMRTSLTLVMTQFILN